MTENWSRLGGSLAIRNVLPLMYSVGVAWRPALSPSEMSALILARTVRSSNAVRASSGSLSPTFRAYSTSEFGPYRWKFANSVSLYSQNLPSRCAR